jgi:iron complex outermembrane receptor protein
MPSDRITNEITYSLKDGKRFSNTYASVEVQNVFTQSRIPDETNGKQDYKLPPRGYALVNADVSSSFKLANLPITLGISGRNLFNQTYREYLNSFRYFTDEVGRNISLRLKIRLQQFY